MGQLFCKYQRKWTNAIIYSFTQTIINIISNYILHETITCDDSNSPWRDDKIKKLILHKIMPSMCILEIERILIFLINFNLRGGSRAAATSKMERFVIIVKGFQLLTIITKRYILDGAAALDPPLSSRTFENYNWGIQAKVLFTPFWLTFKQENKSKVILVNIKDLSK